MVHSPQVHQGRGRGHRDHPAAGRGPRPGHELCLYYPLALLISQRSMAHAPQAALVDSIIGCRRGLLHALGARAERDEYALCGPIRALLRASWWHLPR